MAQNIPQFGLAIDWETTGYSTPNYAARHQGISFGAIIFDVSTLKPVESLYREVKYDSKYTWDAGAEKVHGITKQHLVAHGVSQADAAAELANLVIKYIGTGEVLLLGHRVHFDKAFTNQLMDSIGCEFNYHPTVFDSCSFSTAFLEIAYSDDLFQTVGLPPRGKHNALEDIQYTLESIRRMKEFFIAGIAASF